MLTIATVEGEGAFDITRAGDGRNVLSPLFKWELFAEQLALHESQASPLPDGSLHLHVVIVPVKVVAKRDAIFLGESGVLSLLVELAE